MPSSAPKEGAQLPGFADQLQMLSRWRPAVGSEVFLGFEPLGLRGWGPRGGSEGGVWLKGSLGGERLVGGLKGGRGKVEVGRCWFRLGGSLMSHRIADFAHRQRALLPVLALHPFPQVLAQTLKG